MKKAVLFCLLSVLFLTTRAFAQEAAANAPQQPAQPAEAQQDNSKKVKPLPTCRDFSEVYARAVLGEGEASIEDKEEVMSLAAIMMGYVSAMQDIYGNYLVGANARTTEWDLLDSVNRLCLEYPHWMFQRAVRSIAPIRDTMNSLRDGEFTRCNSYVEQHKSAICMPFCQRMMPLE